ncbi:MAG: replication-associated recombination protein A, partial [Oscillospiraceae bacterium]|nr:replication-associated recombination protein A [Oscillospiraceae bacterium]
SLGTLMAPGGVLLYLDEIQYFNKKQQQSLLEFIENGSITLIASTTENPYFYVYNAILSRSTVFEFKPLGAADLRQALDRALLLLGGEMGRRVRCPDDVADYLCQTAGGDARRLIGAAELLAHASPCPPEGEIVLSLSDAEIAASRAAVRYDREGDAHYDILSAFQKSIRGSDPDAAVHYLARLLAAGDMASASRRLLVMAAEDVGLAYPQAIAIVKACVDAAYMLGLPEAQLPLAQAAVLLATAPKSNSSAAAIWAAMADLRNGKAGDVPAHLQDNHYEGARKLGRGNAYKYPHDFPGHYVAQQYLPDEIQNAAYYRYGDNKTEQAALRYWEAVKKTL